MARLLICLILIQGTLLFGQVTKITDPRVFSNEAVFLRFGELFWAHGGKTGDTYAALGIRFLGEGSSKPTSITLSVGSDIAGWFDMPIRNESDKGNSAGEALILQFRYPLLRVGFTLGNGTETTVARIQALTARGELLGTIEQDSFDEKRGPFVGLETTNPKGISTIVLDYGEEEVGEQVNELRVEFLERRLFKIYLPQVAHGGSAGRGKQGPSCPARRTSGRERS